MLRGGGALSSGKGRGAPTGRVAGGRLVELPQPLVEDGDASLNEQVAEGVEVCGIVEVDEAIFRDEPAEILGEVFEVALRDGSGDLCISGERDQAATSW